MRAALYSVVLVFTLSLRQSADPGAYRRVIDAYRDGGALPGDSVLSGAADLSIVSRAVAPASGWTAADLAAAAMFHTEVALRLAREPKPRDAAADVDAATTLLRAALERDPARAVFARRWRSTVAGLLYAYGARDLAASLGPEALPWLAGTRQQAEARAAFASGLREEIGAAVAGPLSGNLPKRSVTITPEARRALSNASRHFQDALARDPANGEAALHLGRVMLVGGYEIDADRPLRLAAAAADRPVRYLALMFLGAIAERRSQYGDAERLYLEARDAFPWGQSASLALSHVLMRDGREADARAAVKRHFTGAGARLVEPLWTYLADPATDLGPTLNLLRAEVWR
jgi:hypothetical protein